MSVSTPNRSTSGSSRKLGPAGNRISLGSRQDPTAPREGENLGPFFEDAVDGEISGSPNGAVDDEREKRLMMEAIIERRVKEAVEIERERLTKEFETPHPQEIRRTHRPDVTLMNGMLIRDVPRSEEELDQGTMILSRYNRGDDPKEKSKIRERACAPLKPKLALLDFAKLTDSKTGVGALGLLVLAQKTGLDKFVVWCKQYDVYYIFMMPRIQDFKDPFAVSQAPRVDLLTSYKQVTFQAVSNYQEFLNDRLSPVELESSEWALQLLSASTEPNLLMQVKQGYDVLPKRKQGGITFFKIIVDLQDANTFENISLHQTFLREYSLSNTEGEDVVTSVAGFVAVASTLEPGDRPTTLVNLLLEGLLHCSNEKFKTAVMAQLGYLDSPAFDEYIASHGCDKLMLLNKCAEKLKSKYRQLQQAGAWTVPKDTPRFFPAAASSEEDTNAGRPGYVPPKKEWQDWFDRSRCDVKGCGGNHPTKHHNDPGIRNRWFKPRDFKSNKSHGQDSSRSNSNSGSSTPRIKTDKQEEYKKRVYNALFDCVDDDDKHMLVNIAKAAGIDDSDTNKDEEPPRGDEPDEGPDESTSNDDPAMALAAISLGSLLNFSS